VAKTIERSIRKHWVLDMAFREYECRKRKDNETGNFAILIYITLDKHRACRLG